MAIAAEALMKHGGRGDGGQARGLDAISLGRPGGTEDRGGCEIGEAYAAPTNCLTAERFSVQLFCVETRYPLSFKSVMARDTVSRREETRSASSWQEGRP